MHPRTITRINRLTGHAWETRHSDLSHALTLAEQAMDLVSQHGAYPRGEAAALRVLAWGKMHRGDLEEALRLGLRALALYQQVGDTEGETYITYLLGLTLWRASELPQAVEYAVRGLRIAEASGDRLNEMGIHNLLGGIHYDQQQYEEARRHVARMLELAEEVDAQGFRADALNNLALISYRLGNLGKALEAIHGSLSLFDALDREAGHLEALHTAGLIYGALDEWGRAREYFEKGLARARAGDFRASVVEFLVELGQLAVRQGDMESATTHLRQALAAAERLNAPKYLAQSHHAASTLYRAMGQFEKALEHYEKFHLYEKRLFDHEADRRATALHILHDVESARRDAEIYRLQNRALQSELEQQRVTEAYLRDLAATDPLTGLYNRRHFEELAAQRLTHARRARLPVGLAIFDVDDFKVVNDRYGHLAGDRVLARVSSLVRNMVREGDLVGRFAGDEFLILFVNAAPHLCLSVAERLRNEVASTPVETEAGTVSVTICLGLSTRAPEGQESFQELLARADRALYEGKERGGNRVHLAG